MSGVHAFQGTTQHLDLLDGLLEDLLQAKWEAFGRKRCFCTLIIIKKFFKG